MDDTSRSSAHHRPLEDGAPSRRAPRILFVHQNYPAQFYATSLYLKERGWDVLFATAHEAVPAGRVSRDAAGLRVFGYRARRSPSKDVSRYLRPMEKAVVNGQAFASGAINLRDRIGYRPDIVCAHSGWGSGSFARAVWPEARFVQYLEWWYRYPARDAPPPARDANHDDRRANALCRNLPFYLDLQSADAVWVPTKFQAAEMPAEFQSRLTVLHDGVDCEFFAPDQGRPPRCLEGRVPRGARLLTYATRGQEPMRGFPEFMAAVARLQRTHPDVHTVVAGTDTVHYDARLPGGETYRGRALRAHDFDLERLHFVERLELPDYRDLLCRSDLHCYLTRPFVLSWSLIEAVAVGAPLVVSDTPPVREALPDANMALRVDHADIGALAAALGRGLDQPDGMRHMAARARRRALAEYSLKTRLPLKERFFSSVLAGTRPATAS